MGIEDYEITGWDEIEEIANTGNPTSASKAQAKSARKLTLSIANLRLAVFNHQKITGNRLEELTKSINNFNESSGKVATTAIGRIDEKLGDLNKNIKEASDSSDKLTRSVNNVTRVGVAATIVAAVATLLGLVPPFYNFLKDLGVLGK